MHHTHRTPVVRTTVAPQSRRRKPADILERSRTPSRDRATGLAPRCSDSVTGLASGVLTNGTGAEESPAGLCPAGSPGSTDRRVDDPNSAVHYHNHSVEGPPDGGSPAPPGSSSALPIQILNPHDVDERAVDNPIGDPPLFLFGKPYFNGGARDERHLRMTNVIHGAIAKVDPYRNERPTIQRVAQLFGAHTPIPIVRDEPEQVTSTEIPPRGSLAITFYAATSTVSHSTSTGMGSPAIFKASR